jgi:hypothetical protein
MPSQTRPGQAQAGWRSCQEGCTKEIFTCWQVEVAYAPVDGGQARTGKLYPNVKVTQ